MEKVSQISPKIASAVKNPALAARRARYKAEYQLLRLGHDDRESIELYRDLQDRKIRHGEAYPRGKGIGQAQIAYLEQQGVSPDDRLLDIGCGDLRGGRYMIDHLDAGYYTGMDISPEAIRGAWETVLEEDLQDKSPSLQVNTDLRFREFEDDAFDMMFANSVLTHQPIRVIRELFEHVPRVLASDGVAHFSFNDKGEFDRRVTDAVYHSNSYEYPYEYLRDVAGEYGIEAEHDSYKEHPVDAMQMLVCTV